MSRQLSRTVEFGHRNDVVWRALTSSSALASWLAPNNFTPAVGSRFTLQTDAAPGFDGRIIGRVTALRPAERMCWACRAGKLTCDVTFEILAANSQSTRLQLGVDGLDGPAGGAAAVLLSQGMRRICTELLPAYLDSMPDRADAPLPSFSHSKKSTPGRAVNRYELNQSPGTDQPDVDW